MTTKVKYIADNVVTVDQIDLSTLSTSNVSEGTNLYYTDARVGSYLTSNSYATESYVTTAVSNLVDAAPATLDTLNELAAALGDDANFSTTVTTSLAGKVSKSGDTMTGNLGVTGTITADGLTVDGNATLQANTASEAPILTLRNDGDKQAAIVLDADRSSANGSLGQIRGLWNGNGVARIILAAGSDTTNKDDGQITLQTSESGSAYNNRLNIANNGDISFYEDTGTTPKLFWDASAEALGLGTTSPAAALHIAPASGNAILRLEGALAEYWQIIGATNDKFLIQNETDGNVFAIENGNVGIGTTSPSTMLELSTSNSGISAGTAPNNVLRFNDTDAGIAPNQPTGRVEFYVNDATSGGTGVGSYIEGNSAGSAGGGYLTFATSNSGATGASEAMRIDSSGNLLVGTTSTGVAAGGSGTSGINLRSYGGVELARSANPVLFINRTTSDGDIMQFRKDGATVGSIGTVSGKLQITTGYTLITSDDAADGGFIADFGRSGQQNGLKVARYTVGSDNDRVGFYFQNEGVLNTRFWVDDTGDVRVKGSTPTSDTDGTVVGTQTFTGTHIYKTDETDLEIGETVCLVGKKIVRSSSAKSKTVAGIYAGESWKLVDSFGDKCRDAEGNPINGAGHAVIALGDTHLFQSGNTAVGVFVDGPVQAGDLLCTSSVPGRLMVQDDDLIHSYTVAKAMEDGDGTSPIYAYVYSG